MDQLQHLQEYALQSIPKKDIAKRAQIEAAKLLATGNDIIPVYVQLHRVREYADKLMGSLKEKVIDERQRYAEKEKIKVYGAEVAVMESGISYDFSVCNDPEWNRLNKELAHVKELLKDRETLLKGIKEPWPIADPNTGEEYTLYPPAKKSTTAPNIRY